MGPTGRVEQGETLRRLPDSRRRKHRRQFTRTIRQEHGSALYCLPVACAPVTHGILKDTGHEYVEPQMAVIIDRLKTSVALASKTETSSASRQP